MHLRRPYLLQGRQESTIEKKTVSSISGSQKTGQLQVKEWNFLTLSNTIYKNKLKINEYLNIKPETIKLLEENIGRTLWHKLQLDLLGPPPRVTEIKTKINNLNLIKLKSFCTARETINKMKRQPSGWEKRITNETTDKRLISKIYKWIMQLSIRKTNKPIKTWAEYLNWHFSKEDMLTDNKHMKRSSTSLIMGEMQIKAIIRLSFTMIRISIIKKISKQ